MVWAACRTSAGEEKALMLVVPGTIPGAIELGFGVMVTRDRITSDSLDPSSKITLAVPVPGSRVSRVPALNWPSVVCTATGNAWSLVH